MHERTIGHVVVEVILLRRCIVSLFGWFAKFCDGLFEHRPYVVLKLHQGLSLPTS